MKYGYWRTDKPKEKGFSHEFISSDTEHLIKNTGATLDTLYGCEYAGVDTCLKALKRVKRLMPGHKWMGTRVADEYQWVTIKEVADIAENLSYGFKKLDLAIVNSGGIGAANLAHVNSFVLRRQH